MSDVTAELTDHEYDGIREYDNPLPGWWSLIFFLSTVFAIGYGVHYHLGGEGESVEDEYGAEAAAVFELRFAELGELQPDRATLLAYMNDPQWLAVGQAVFKANCVSCHGADAQGDIGPNLTDDSWKNVDHIEDIARVIADGAGNGSMPAWRTRLSHVNQIVLTAAYIASLRGSNPAGGRDPEGDAIPAWDAEGNGG
jgi:cytochrome c oxidase cbb3-type subunit III